MSRFTIPQERAERFRQEGYWGDVTIPGLFRQNLDRNPDAIGLVDAPNRPTFFEGAPRRLTYRQMDSEIALYANTLRAAGLGKGDIIAQYCRNDPDISGDLQDWRHFEPHIHVLSRQ